jgi:THO complex subunit 5
MLAHFARLDRKVKELAQEKEDLLKNSKSQAATTESVKMQIEALLKVALFLSCLEKPLSVIVLPDRIRNRQEGRGACSCYYKHTP